MIIIYPKWPKLKEQTTFNLPPHGPVCFAATLDPSIEISFYDENVEEIDFNEEADLIAFSVMLTCQMPRAWEIADAYRAKGRTVIFGGIGTMLHAKETQDHADAILLGESEGIISDVIRDHENGKLKKVYDYQNQLPEISVVGTARRDILKRDLYNFRGVQMVDLVHMSRGCRFNCFPCCAQYLGGRRFRPRPVDKVIEEIKSIDNNRLFLVDNSLAQDDDWEKEIFKALIPLKKKWISHPIKDDDEILDLAAKAGCWYVYQAIVDTSDHMRNRVKRLKDRGICVEGTILLGLEHHDEDYIKRMVDFLLEIELDMAEFTILTPFPHTPFRTEMEEQGRLLHNDWVKYTCGEVVFQPKKMTVDSLKKMYEYSWKTFYSDCCQEIKMAKLFMDVINKEKKDGTFKRPKRQLRRQQV
ncbi:BchE/P-methylase family protein [hydrothermal vent metagenome]|uniref:BchE/P-methylase family protein n=1 Tax=hydrothermal vent metagenome TaxID=652676 RepID=A0A3B1DSS3_9ZZZZ